MHQGLEQHWELKKAGKHFEDFDAIYRAAQQPGDSLNETTQKFSFKIPSPALPPRPPPNPELLRQALDDERAKEARENPPNARRFLRVCIAARPGGVA